MSNKTPQRSEEYWNNIGSAVLTELERRLGEESDARDLPGTLLMRLAEKYLQYLDKVAKEADEEKHYMTAMEAIDQEGLPLDSKVEILKDYIDKLEEDHTIALERLHVLIREQNGLPPLHEPESSAVERALPSQEGAVSILREHAESVQQGAENGSSE